MTEKEKIKYNAEAVGVDDLLELWIDSFHDDVHIVVIHDPLEHLNTLKKLKIPNNFNNLYKGKVLLLSFTKVDQALFVFKVLSKEEPAPYCQLYCFGKYLSDSIDELTN